MYRMTAAHTSIVAPPLAPVPLSNHWPMLVACLLIVAAEHDEFIPHQNVSTYLRRVALE
jgi:hypothetical protein